MPSRAYGPDFYSEEQLREKVRYLTEQIDSALASTSDGLGASAAVTGLRSMQRIREEVLDELDRRAGKPARRRWNYTQIVPNSGYGFGYRRTRPWEL